MQQLKVMLHRQIQQELKEFILSKRYMGNTQIFYFYHHSATDPYITFCQQLIKTKSNTRQAKLQTTKLKNFHR